MTLTCAACGATVTPGPRCCPQCGAKLHASVGDPSRRLQIGGAVTTLVAAPWAFLCLVGTQAMSGSESAMTLLAFFAYAILLPYGGLAVLLMLPAAVASENRRGYWLAVGGFAGGGVVGTVAGVVAMLTGSLVIFTGVPIILLPAATGWYGIWRARRSVVTK